MKYLFTLLLLIVSTTAISQDKYSYFVKDAAYNRFAGVNIHVIHSKSQKINQEQTSDSLGFIQFTRFNRKTHQLRAIIKDNLHLDSTIHSAEDYIISIKGNRHYYDSIQVIKDSLENIANQLKFSKLHPDKWRKIDAYYDSIPDSNKKTDSITKLLPNSKIGEKNIKPLPVPQKKEKGF